MKKKILWAMTLVMVLGSIKAMASEVEGNAECIECQIQIDKTETAESDQQMINLLKVSIKAQINELWTLQSQLQDIEDSSHLVTDLAQTYENALVDAESLDLHFDLQKATQMNKDLSKVISDAKIQMQKIR